MKNMLHEMKLIVISVLQIIFSVIPKKKNLIVFSAWFGQKYCDNSMYIFEYYLKYKPDFEVWWYTRNKKIYKKLKECKLPVLYSWSLKAVIKQLRASILVTSVQLMDFNPYFLTKCLYIDLGHGFPIKLSGFDEPGCDEGFIKYQLKIRKNIDYYMTSSSKSVMNITKKAFQLDNKHIIFSNMPRTDVLFDEQMQIGKNKIISDLKYQNKIIVYMPTHRSDGKVPINIHEIFDINEIQNICEQSNSIFIIKKHFYHRNEKTDLTAYSRIIDLTGDNNLETQTLLAQADLLVTDYSACYIDFLLLDRPILLYPYDLNNFIKTERDMYLSFSEVDIGFKAFSRNEFNKYLSYICKSWVDDAHIEGRKKLRLRYFDEDVTLGNSRKNITLIFDQLMEGKYYPKWE